LASPATLLEVSNLHAGYGGAVALSGVTFELLEGELLLLVGPNGAGKSTLMKVLVGLHRAQTGQVLFRNRDITSLKPHQRARLGIAWVAEGRGIIRELSVEENLDIARFSHDWTQARREASLERFPILRRTLKRQAGTLSGGEQQMLAIARALETGAELLLIDEPSLGLAPIIVNEVLELLGELAAEGNSILLVEQRAAQVQHIATRSFLMQQGRLTTTDGRLEFTEMSLAEFSGTEG